MRTILFTIAFCLFGLLAGFFVGKRLYFWRKTPTVADDVRFYDSLNVARIAFYSHFPLQKGDTVLAGNSIAEGFPLSEAFPGRHIRNRGIGGNTTQRLLLRIGDIARSQPAMIILEIGINDIRGGIKKETILTNFEKIIDTVQANCRAKIVMQEVMPVGDNYASLRPAIRTMNTMIAELGLSHGLPVLHLYNAFLQGASMRPFYTVDGIHLTADGYLVWKHKLDSIFAAAPTSTPMLSHTPRRS